MARQQHNAAFITGSILGGVAGAAVALWRAPRSGAELRAAVSERFGSGRPATSTILPDGSDGSTVSDPSVAPISRARASITSVSKASRESISSTASKGLEIWNATTSPETRGFGGGSRIGDKALSFVENATAPIVGVKLGQTARTAGSKAMETVRSGSGGSAQRAPEQPPAPAASVAPAAPIVPAAPVSTATAVASSAAPASASPEPTTELSDAGIGHAASTEELVTPILPDNPQGSTAQQSGSFTKFPEFDADKRTT